MVNNRPLIILGLYNLGTIKKNITSCFVQHDVFVDFIFISDKINVLIKKNILTAWDIVNILLW